MDNAEHPRQRIAMVLLAVRIRRVAALPITEIQERTLVTE
jgi:hypothetical protein